MAKKQKGQSVDQKMNELKKNGKVQLGGGTTESLDRDGNKRLRTSTRTEIHLSMSEAGDFLKDVLTKYQNKPDSVDIFVNHKNGWGSDDVHISVTEYIEPNELLDRIRR